MNRHEVAVSVRVRASAESVWDALTDWPAQSQWIPATTVRTVAGDGRGVGGRIEAFTGIGRLGFLDTMEVTEWRPPTWCAVRHTGRVVRGTGAFEITPAAEGADGVTLTWHEWLEIPGGRLGARAFAAAKPVFEWSVLRALTRFARLSQSRRPGR